MVTNDNAADLIYIGRRARRAPGADIGGLVRRAMLSRQAVMVAVMAVLGTFGAAAPAAAAPAAAAPHVTPAAGLVAAPHPSRLPFGARRVCPVPSQPGQMECMSVIRGGTENAAAGMRPARATPGFGPSSLLSAYNLTAASARGGRGKTIALVAAFSDPSAAGNLANYRRHYKLPACTRASGCLRIVNEHGKARPLPPANADWALVESQGLDMVSAICPKCHILLVEAASNFITDLGAAENTAVAKGAKFVSNGWSGGEFVGEQADDHYFNHPGVAVTFAAGNAGYGPAYPTDSQYVTAVGGTSLSRVRTRRGWTESVWAATGSGCSTFEAKPSWQRVHATGPSGCLNRAENDVAAVANPNTGAAIYDTYRQSGWLETGGTSVASTIIAAVYALAGTPAARTYPASYPYRHATDFHQVATGSNGTCESNRQYLCHGEHGYNGPGGLGTPLGTAGFSDSGARPVTLVDPGTQDRETGAAFALRIKGLDANRRAASLAYSATGLPAGLSVRSARHSTDGMITGTLPGSAHAFAVTVTAKDRRTRQSGSTRFTIVAVASMRPSAPANSQLKLAFGADCLDGNGGASGDSVVVDQSCQEQFLQWAYIPGGAPGGPGELSLVGSGGLCLALAGSLGQLAACAPGAANQTWAYPGFSQLENPSTGRCLGDANPGHQGTQVSLLACGQSSAQTWTFTSANAQSAIPGLCLAFRSGSPPASLEVAACGGGTHQSFQFEPNGIIEAGNGCVVGASLRRDGAAPVVSGCGSGTDPAETWHSGPNGELINQGTGLCLDDPGNSTASGTKVLLEDCYGQPGEIWAVN
jgi:Ricin-type beta-trefoil lectin domain